MAVAPVTVARRTGRVVQVGQWQRSGEHYARAIEIVKLPESLGGTPAGGFHPRVIDGDHGESHVAANVEPTAYAAVELPVMGRIAAGKQRRRRSQHFRS